jgi:hypothetical protein
MLELRGGLQTGRQALWPSEPRHSPNKATPSYYTKNESFASGISKMWCVFSFPPLGGIYRAMGELHRLGEFSLVPSGGRPAGSVEQPPLTFSTTLAFYSSSCSPSRLTSLTASSRSRTKARVNFTWSAKHPMWSRSPVGITTASAPSQVRLGKWRYYDCSICSSASCYSSSKASHAASLMPPSNILLGVVTSTT